MKYFLESAGAKVTIAEDGRQAVDAAMRRRQEGETFDLILMDMQMPIMTGHEAVRALRQEGFQTPIIALTADAMEGERQACLSSGCNEYVTKPIDGEDLVQLVARFLDGEG